MHDCCNPNCDKKASGTKLRCGLCKRRSNYCCAICGDLLSLCNRTRRAVYCKDCYHMTRNDYQMRYSKIYNEKKREREYIVRRCKMCSNIISRARKYCSKKCYLESWNKKWRKRLIDNCIICNKDLLGTGRGMTCSIECYTHYRRYKCREYHIKIKGRSYVPIPLSN